MQFKQKILIEGRLYVLIDDRNQVVFVDKLNAR